jgi:hypothetical protein
MLQLQPTRAAGLSAASVTVVLARLAAALKDVREFSFVRGTDQGPYINYMFTTERPAKVWRALNARALRHRRFGSRLRRASIVTCQGSRGWKNYLLLHHFDDAQIRDALPGV